MVDPRKHYCNLVIDPATCCSCAHGDPNEEHCTCHDWWKVMHDVRGARKEKYFSELVSTLKGGRVLNARRFDWFKIFEQWDRYAAQGELEFTFDVNRC